MDPLAPVTPTTILLFAMFTKFLFQLWNKSGAF